MIRQILIVIIFLCFTITSYAQIIKKSDSLSTKQVIDTLLIDRDMNNWSLRLFTNYKGQSFNLVNGDNQLSFKPNNRAGVGFGLGTSKLIIDIAFNLKSKEENPTERFDMQGSFIAGNHNLINLYVQRYKGFNVKNNFNEPEFFRDDITSLSIGINYLYTFKEISFSSATLKAGLAKEEKKHYISGGIGGFMVYNNFMADSPIIPDNGNFNEDAYLKGLKGTGIGISGGVLTVFVLPANFFATLNVIPGIGIMYKKGFSETDDYKVSNPLLYKLDYEAGVGYSYKRFYITLVYGSGIYTTNLDYGLNYIYSNTKAKISVGYKIKSNKKLKTPF
ncbi:DUF4421 family protein [Xanthomarina sp. F2636L]|uniref:DUF4421 family protein n=1 Tax=Xanthomarina sp. F2636L TaxID=2996018 RepID=UPI00225E094C|nr:DUF4421 family protein [Xanthomarina sp. F2636L]MCX7550241.1 DUF4421 family protein [Xanthomarina sp. F2636L]